MRTALILISAAILSAGCATTGTDGQSNLTAAEPAAVESQDGKQSLSKMLDENDRVTLVDDDTGETKLICRRVKPSTGSRLGTRKVCATKKQWRDQEIAAKDEVTRTQRNMDSSCPTCN